MSAPSSDLLAPLDPRLVRFGNSEGFLLGGPPAAEGAESLDRHLARLGPAPLLSSDAILAEVRASGLQGRGGGSFPLARKLETALRSPGQPLLVVNCSESEPASRKDRVICSSRPTSFSTEPRPSPRSSALSEAVIHLHGSSTEMLSALRVALAERRSVSGDPQWQLSRWSRWVCRRRVERRGALRPLGCGAPLLLVDPPCPSGPFGPPDGGVERRDGGPRRPHCAWRCCALA